MQIKKVNLVYFSPTGNVQKTLRKIAGGTGLTIQEYDLTPPAARRKKYSFTAEDLVLIGVPVYYGRIPGVIAEYLREINAENTPAVFVVSFGNRGYDDALLELKQSGEQRGLVGLAAAAFIGEHAASPEVAIGRPDSLDDEKAFLFGQKIREKINDATNVNQMGDLQVKGNFPYIDRKMSVYPSTSDRCDNCGTCARECPMSAINPRDTGKVDPERCISCFRCIRNCPQGAKYMGNDKFNKLIAKIAQISTERKEPETFI
ncbi:MAG TPA: 4Fe-4S binding protein [Firmicutes bacterium]|jgi:ferredoxin|nr:4Fe-4S binding protein [Bacillota bacterium]